jgi:lipoyl(octanoyl) transferase
MNWRFENTGAHSGVFNMDYDRTLAQALIKCAGKSTIRIYCWSPPAISLGWNQPLDAVDSPKALAAGIDIVQRPTGGRAILHSDELTYSVVMRVKEKNAHTVYESISNALVVSLKKIGVRVCIEKSQPDFSSLYRAPSGAVCFSSAGRYEIKYGGKKLVGSAQRRYATEDGEEVVLQHGSILLGPDHKRIADFLNLPSDKERYDLRRMLDQKTTDLSTVLNREVTFRETAEMLLKGFKEAWSIVPEVVNLVFEKEEVNV